MNTSHNTSPNRIHALICNNFPKEVNDLNTLQHVNLSYTEHTTLLNEVQKLNYVGYNQSFGTSFILNEEEIDTVGGYSFEEHDGIVCWSTISAIFI